MKNEGWLGGINDITHKCLAHKQTKQTKKPPKPQKVGNNFQNQVQAVASKNIILYSFKWRSDSPFIKDWFE